MSDQGFSFGPPPERREPRKFEPPPWERDRFEELAQKKAPEVSPETQVNEAQAAAPPAESGGAEAAAAGATRPAEAPAAPAPKKAGELDEKHVAAMLIDLKTEEPRFLSRGWVFQLAAAGVVGVIGSAMLIWGIVAMSLTGKAGTMGMLGGVVLDGFGAAFVAVGVWLAFRTLRQRGVL